jgi:hypothetical protein
MKTLVATPLDDAFIRHQHRNILPFIFDIMSKHGTSKSVQHVLIALKTVATAEYALCWRSPCAFAQLQLEAGP